MAPNFSFFNFYSAIAMSKSSCIGSINGATQTRSKNSSVLGRKMPKMPWKKAALRNSVIISTNVVYCSDRWGTWSSLRKYVAIKCTKDAWRSALRLRWKPKSRRCKLSRSSSRHWSRNLRRSIGLSCERRRYLRTNAIKHTFEVSQLFRMRPLRCLTLH